MHVSAYELVSILVNLLSVFILAISLRYASISIRHTSDVSEKNSEDLMKSDRFNKRADTIMHCNVRYDELYNFRTSILQIGQADPQLIPSLTQIYYSRFWGLQSDQFDYWLADLIDIETFSNWWFNIVAKSIDKHIPFPSAWNIQEGWNQCELSHRDANPWFHSFVGQMMLIVEKKNRYASIHDRILDVIGVYERETEDYRRKLADTMTMEYYRESLKKKITPPSLRAR